MGGFDVSTRYIEGDYTARDAVRRPGVPSRAGRAWGGPGYPFAPMSFRPDSLGATTRPAGQVDYRLARNAIIKEFRRGRLTRLDVCDAQPELLRNAEHCGRPATEPCPICEAEMVLVTYVFGSRMPPSGRCITKIDDLAKLDRAAEERAAYVVEVCSGCAWNHLVRSFPLGRRRSRLD